MGINPQEPQSIDIVNNCFLSDCYRMMAEIAGLIGKEADVALYKQRQAELNSSIHDTFFDEDSCLYASGSQIDMIYPMLVGATPVDQLEKVRESLMKVSEERFRGHIATGLVGVSVLTQWATRNREAEYIYGMLKKRTYPGYLYMMDNGATLTWEEWDGERSQLHNCYNAIGSWFIQALAGIVPDESAPGYSHFYIRPQVVEGISWVKASKDTPYGIVEVSWMYKKGRVCVSASIPAGATATLCLPDGRELNLESGRHLI
jgi:alpha-L-rhamnosidase